MLSLVLSSFHTLQSPIKPTTNLFPLQLGVKPLGNIKMKPLGEDFDR